ncbi:MAG TPA: hypothetical protein VK155_19695 [Bacteroidales bacterium]|jgi:hypothetical protein|nr:hypothetical protein [Bacteroidales bacterium]
MFKEKNEYRLHGSFGLGTGTICFEGQGAYSVTSNFGIMTNFMSAKGIENSSKSWAKGNYFDVAIGYYKPLRKSGVFEIYGGVGGSKQHHQYMAENYDPSNPLYNNSNAGTSNESFIKIFIQPSIGITFNWFDFAFSTRFNRLTFNNIENQIDITSNKPEFDKLFFTTQTKNFWFFEPALTIRGGWKYFKIQLQGSTGSYLNNEHYQFDQFHISAGINIASKKIFNRGIKITRNVHDNRITKHKKTF